MQPLSRNKQDLSLFQQEQLLIFLTICMAMETSTISKDMLTVFGSSTSSMSSPTSKLLPELDIHMCVVYIVQFGIVTDDDIL